MPAHLVALTEGPSILLDKPILLLGRHPECDVQIDSRKISRRHCCIAQVSDYLVVRDLGSTNGIRVNGERVHESRLTEGDELTIGTLAYQVTWNEPAEAPEARGRQEPPSGVRPVEDDLLESADEPIPLEEPGRPAAKRPVPPPLPPRRTDGSPVLPEEMQLRPLSGDNEGVPSAPSAPSAASEVPSSR
jgi:pSer/pThr/pTyr-binding forkhead associated (FHA) protein